MADEVQREALSRGADAWNRWREENELDGPDLRGVIMPTAILAGADLSGADLRDSQLGATDLEAADLSNTVLAGVNLTAANLRGASLENADCLGALLYGARLPESVLTRANLFKADLSQADLTNADLRGTRLIETNMHQAVMHGVTLRDAVIAGTILADTDLSRVRGLETCRHDGPSVVDHNTLRRSNNIDVSFLRGCGLPDSLIESTTTFWTPGFYSCFISYSSKDTAFAERLYADLQKTGVRCWYAPVDMRIGDKVRETIIVALRQQDKTLLVLSKHSVASDWVEEEVDASFESESKGERMFPIRIDDAILKSEAGWAAKLRSRHMGDFTGWEDDKSYEEGFRRLTRDLKRVPADARPPDS